MSELCPCGTGSSFALCCGRFIAGKAFPSTAEELMRSRYSAYVKNDPEYILATTHSSQRRYYSRKAIERWAAESSWLRLEITAVTDATVEFKAYYSDPEEKIIVHHEFSTFVFENGRWYFYEGEAR